MIIDEITLQMLYNTIMYVTPGAIWLIVTTIIIWLSFLLGTKHADKVWKNNIKLHMPKVTKEEIRIRDKKIILLKEQLIKCQDENKKLLKCSNTIKKITNVMAEEIPEKKIVKGVKK